MSKPSVMIKVFTSQLRHSPCVECGGVNNESCTGCGGTDSVVYIPYKVYTRAIEVATNRKINRERRARR